VEKGEMLTFKVLLSDENRLYDIMENLEFTSEKELGTMESPYRFNLSSTTGVPVTTLPGGISIGEIFPNPFEFSASLEVMVNKPGRFEGTIINRLGQVVRKAFDLKVETGSNLLNINSKGLTPGFYTLMITYWDDQTKSIISKKMVIK
jgi:hypothetical protein